MKRLQVFLRIRYFCRLGNSWLADFASELNTHNIPKCNIKYMVDYTPLRCYCFYNITQIKYDIQNERGDSMTYEGFVKELTGTLTKELGPEYHLKFNRLLKNNDITRDTLVILRQGENASPAFSLADFYEKYRGGEEMASISKRITGLYHEDHFARNMDLDFLWDWERVKDRIVCRLVGAGRNKTRLQKVLHRQFLDMAVIYRYEFESQEDYTASLIVENAFLEKWGISFEQFDETARANTARLSPPAFMSMDRIMADLLGSELLSAELHNEEMPIGHGGELFVLTNSRRMHGAYWMSEREVLETVREQVGDGFLILPSSVHECMIIPDGAGPSPAEMAGMVRDINRHEVEPEEVLTDSVYRYCSDTGVQIEA